jgi:CRISPR-associated protein Cmr3
VHEESEFVEREYRFGIAMERSQRTARESYLYLAEFLRLKENVAFWVEVDGITPADLGGERGFLQLGGEARAAYYEVRESRLGSLLSPPNPLPDRFKVVLLTPAWFSGGWVPQNRNWSPFFNGSVRLVSAIIPRYQAIGGAYVDDQRRRAAFQKPMRRFVPAGSVYFFEREGTASWAGKPFTETPPNEGNYGQIGFGTCLISEWNYA